MGSAPSANVERMITRRAPEPEASGRAPEVSAQAGSDDELLADHDILRVRAPNPGPLTLSGTNTWLAGRNPTWVVDPGPLVEEHLDRLVEAIDARGGLGGVALTHDHSDHSEAVPALLARRAAPLAAGRGRADVRLGDGVRFGPLEAVPTPGHAPDHFALIADGACFTGDAVLGEGSVFISPYHGAMSAYLRALARLRARPDLDVLCPGHGPPVWDPQAKLEEYLSHRMDRENNLIAALGEGLRTVPELLEAVWSDVPERLRPLATVTLAAHLDKLEEDEILPAGVERPDLQHADW
jgi:glyoxylase-like metal-dependent hydrolase (beta-lactamase superfamily II)